VVRHVDAIGKTDQSLIAITMTGRITNAPSTSGLKVQASHQQAHPTTCSHNDLVVRGRAAWWRFEAASVPNLCQFAAPTTGDWSAVMSVCDSVCASRPNPTGRPAFHLIGTTAQEPAQADRECILP
jgi:hypothetical protein